MAARRVTYQEYLQWAALRPRTNDWSALVAYDKDKCNHLLHQEYIQKFDSNSYMPPIDDTFATGETTWYWLNNYQTDVPRLSFENNPDGNGGNVAEANMSMAIVGGTEIELYGGPGGGSEVTSISSFDPLDHPELKANRVSLKDIVGQVDQGGSVVLDLGDPAAQRYIWELTGSRIECERRKGGAFMKRKFREAEPARRSYKLGQLAYTEQEFLKPAKFKMRTVMEAGANVRNAANFGNGALELRIAMKGELEGGFPGEDWLYPIPSDLPELDSSLILSNKILMRHVIANGIAAALNAPDAEFDEVKDGVNITLLKVRPTNNGEFYVPSTEYSDLGWRFRWFAIPMYIDSDRLLTIRDYGQERIQLGLGGVDARINCGVWIGGDLDVKQFDMGVAISGKVSFKVDEDVRKIKVEVSDLSVRIAVTNQQQIPDNVVQFINNQSSPFNQQITAHCKSEITKIFNEALASIDVFVLHSLLFNSTDAVQLKTVNISGELISFGSLSPRLTTFTIDPAEQLLGYGATHTFTTNPVVAGLKWSVSNLDGSTAGVGQIDANTGRYTAPGVDQIGGTYKRIKVSATGTGSNPHVSKALVTIAARAVTLNPLVQTCPASDGEVQTRQFTANTLDGALKWSVIGDGRIPENANPDRTNVYTAPPKEDIAITKRTFSVDEVKVLNTATPQTQSSFVVVTHDRQALSLTVELQGSAPTQARFTAKFNGQTPPAPITWGCFPATGAGTIDANGLYTANPSSAHQFVVITARCVIGEGDSAFFLGDAFSIQPLPLGALPAKPNPEIPQGSFDGLPQI